MTYAGRTVFSKLARGRFPTVDDVVKPLRAMQTKDRSAPAVAATTGTTTAP